MTPQPDLQTISLHILPNISKSESNEIKVKFGQIIEHKKRNTFYKKLCGKWGRENSARPLFIFQKNLIWGESKWSVA